MLCTSPPWRVSSVLDPNRCCVGKECRPGGLRRLLVALPRGLRCLPCETRLGAAYLSVRRACRTADRPLTPRWRLQAGDTAVPVCALGRENHPLAGDHPVLLPSLSPVQEGSGKVVGSGGGTWWHTCSRLVVVGVLCARCTRPGGEAWARAHNLVVTGTCCQAVP